MWSHIPGRGDSQLNAWILAWGSHAIAHQPLELFNANIFYPAHNTFALSENMLGNQLFFGPLYGLTHNPALGYNVVLLLDFFLTAATMYLLVRWLTGSIWAGAVAGLIFSFCPARYHQFGHMQLLAMEWTPLAVFFLVRWFHRWHKRDLIGFAFALFMQLLCSIYLGYMALIIVAIFAAVLLVVCRASFSLSRTAWLIFSGCMVGALMLPILLHYQRLERTLLNHVDFMGIVTAASASPLGSYLNGAGIAYHGIFDRYLHGEYEWEKRLFIGLMALVLAATSLPLLQRKKLNVSSLEQPAKDLVFASMWGGLLVALVNYVLSLGPYLHIHGRLTHVRLPSYWLRLVVPGLAHFRAPARFGIAAMFGVAILAGIGCDCILRSVVRRYPKLWLKTAIGLSLLLLITLEYKAPNISLNPMFVPGSVPPEYVWLKQRDNRRAVMEFPITRKDDIVDPYEEAAYDYNSIFHWHPLVNAYSGYTPPTSSELMRLMSDMPTALATRIFASLGIGYAILHTDKIAPSQLEQWQQAAARYGYVTLLQQWSNSAVYELHAPQCPPQIMGTVDAPAISAAGQPFFFVLQLSPRGPCWVNSSADNSAKLEATWIAAGGKPVLHEHSFPVNLPLYAERGAVFDSVVVFGRSPESSGDYELRLAADGSGLTLKPIRVKLSAAPPSNSENDPGELAANYNLLASQPTLTAGEREYIEFAASNTGKAVWLRGMRRGSVRLGYQWFNDQGKKIADERLDLPYDVYPGTSFTFRSQIHTPSEPGRYILKLELVSELVNWFHDRGTAPVEFSVYVKQAKP